MSGNETSDGSTANYYVLPAGAEQLQDLISFRNMNAQMGEIFRATYRYGMVAHSPKIRDLKKIIFYAQKEIERIEKYESQQPKTMNYDTIDLSNLTCGPIYGGLNYNDLTGRN
jgi:hypothetical protein